MSLPLTFDQLIKGLRTYFPLHAHSIGEHLDKELALFSLTNGPLYLQLSDCDVDTDGLPSPGIVYESTHQAQTSLRWPNGESMTSLDTPFFVLPIHWQHGVALGDVGILFTETHSVAFICGDMGPPEKIGEVSLRVFEELGASRIKANKHILDASLDAPCRVIFFAGTASKDANGKPFCLTNTTIMARALASWQKLGV